MQKKPAVPGNKRRHTSSDDNDSDNGDPLPAASIIERTASGATSTSASNVPPPSTGSDDSGDDDGAGDVDPEMTTTFHEGPVFDEEPSRLSSDTVRLPPPPRLEHQTLTGAKQQARLNELAIPQAGPSESHAAPGFDRPRAEAMRAQLKEMVSKRLPALAAGLSALKDLDGPLQPAHEVLGNARTRAAEILGIFKVLHVESGSNKFESAGEMLNAI